MKGGGRWPVCRNAFVKRSRAYPNSKGVRLLSAKEILEIMNPKQASILLAVVLAAFNCGLAGCGNDRADPNKSREVRKADSRKEQDAKDAELRAKIARQTAALKAERDSVAKTQQGIAIGELKFGMTEKEAWAAINTMREGGAIYPVGNYEYYIDPIFNSEGKLYRVQLRTASVNASHIDRKVAPAVEDLITVIETKYGPAENRKWKLDFFAFDPNTMQIMGRWNVGTKRILVGGVEASGGAQYSAQAWIWDAPMKNLVDNAELRKEAGAQMKSADKF